MVEHVPTSKIEQNPSKKIEQSMFSRFFLKNFRIKNTHMGSVGSVPLDASVGEQTQKVRTV